MKENLKKMNDILISASYDLNVYLTKLNKDSDLNNLETTSFKIQNTQVNRIVGTKDRKFMICTNPHMSLYDPNNTSKPISQYLGHSTNVTDVVFNDDTFYSSSEDRFIRKWSRNSPKFNGYINTEASLNAIDIIDDNHLIVCNEKGNVEIYDIRSEENKPVFSLNLSHSPVRSMALTKNKKNLVAVTHDCKGFHIGVDHSSLNIIGKFDTNVSDQPSEKTNNASIPLRVVLSPDESNFVTTAADSSIKLWSRKDLSYIGEYRSDVTKFVWDAAFTSDGKLLITGGTDKPIRIWDYESRNLKASFTAASKGITCLAII